MRHAAGVCRRLQSCFRPLARGAWLPARRAFHILLDMPGLLPVLVGTSLFIAVTHGTLLSLRPGFEG
jgi:hypothetical protein